MADVLTKATHTPGPWTVDPVLAHTRKELGSESTAFWIAGGRLDEVLASVHEPINDGTPDANARLIAAAPDLYRALAIDDIDALIDGVDHFIIGDAGDEVEAIWQPYIDKLQALRAAIVKAAEGDPR